MGNFEAGEPTKPFEIFNSVISLIGSTDPIKIGLLSRRCHATDMARTITEIINRSISNDSDKLELLNATMGLMWLYGEARVSLAQDEEKESKRERAERARAIKAIGSQRINLVIARHGIRRLQVAPTTHRNANAIASAIFDAVSADFKKFGDKPICLSAVTKRVRELLPSWEKGQIGVDL